MIAPSPLARGSAVDKLRHTVADARGQGSAPPSTSNTFQDDDDSAVVASSQQRAGVLSAASPSVRADQMHTQSQLPARRFPTVPQDLNASAGARARDPNGTEVRHAGVLKYNPNAFHRVTGPVSSYLDVLMQSKSLIPSMGPHERLSAMMSALPGHLAHLQHASDEELQQLAKYGAVVGGEEGPLFSDSIKQSTCFVRKTVLECTSRSRSGNNIFLGLTINLASATVPPLKSGGNI